MAGNGAFPCQPLISCWQGGTPVFSCSRVFTVEMLSWSGTCKQSTISRIISNYNAFVFTLRCIMVSLYSTLSSSILLLVELTMKSEAMDHWI